MKYRGFTLIEVVVALSILGIGLTVIIELFSGGLRLGRTSEEYTRAVSFARMKMEEISSQPTIEEGTEEGEFDEKYRWQMTAKKVDILPAEVKKGSDYKPPVDLFQVKIDVLWKLGSHERSTSIESYKICKSGEEEKKS
jgi:general secretion pathway protein I